MLQKRVIPCLLLHKNGLYKTVKFKNPNYIGDPINAIKIFNEKEVDELIILDIDATVEEKEPNYKFIEDIASECFMPLCYGGGVKNIEQMKKIYALGVEKISLSSVSISNPSLISQASKIFGKQSIIVTVDVKKDFWGKQKVFINNGKKNTKIDILEHILNIEKLGAGEVVINSIDNDGLMQGFDIDLLKKAKEIINIPIVALGGAGKNEDITKVFKQTDISAVAVGSMFVYHGALNGVLINYPSYDKLKEIINE